MKKTLGLITSVLFASSAAMAGTPNYGGAIPVTALSDSTGAPITTANPLTVTTGSTSGGTTPSSATLAGTATTTASPTYTTGTMNPLSTDVHGGLRALIQDSSGVAVDWTLPVTVYPEPLPSGAIFVADSSGNVANATATATLAATSGKTTYIKNFTCTPGGATAAGEVTVTVTNISNAGVAKTLSYTAGAPLGATVSGSPLTISFGDGAPAFQANTTIVISMPALGTGNTNASCSAVGYQK